MTGVQERTRTQRRRSGEGGRETNAGRVSSSRSSRSRGVGRQSAEQALEEIRAKNGLSRSAPSSEKADESEDTERNMRKASMAMFLSDFGPPH